MKLGLKGNEVKLVAYTNEWTTGFNRVKEAEEYFKSECKAVGQAFKEDMLLVCERFELIHT